ncbi:MAG: hypothetical protein L3J63_10695, partial [Geopsychrobacter sp.]|nr:hypothetical protein [Geopsychrobacter sp.]
MFALLFALLLSGCGQNHSYPQAEKGRLNLSGWDFNQNGPVQLEGEWEFYWEKLLEPTDSQRISRLERIDYI